MGRPGEPRLQDLPGGKGAVQPGGPIPETVPEAVTAAGARAVEAWREAVAPSGWGDVLGRSDVPTLRVYCTLACELDAVRAAIAEFGARGVASGEYRHYSMAQLLQSRRDMLSRMSRTEQILTRRQMAAGGRPHKAPPAGGPRGGRAARRGAADETPWADGPVQ